MTKFTVREVMLLVLATATVDPDTFDNDAVKSVIYKAKAACTITDDAVWCDGIRVTR